ncbi:site-specific integrase [Rhodococcus opacus]|uniref:site-specific integrase n=1 Tax=Rhodococcus opacus TaxID=37919 RepID=UPI0007CD797C|nr:site-specific integrase [Rhodococcus opacus]MDX5969849.1 site-specific integrase [Rhodococcus opacus]CAG7635439.1 Tyrosine recombinase XerC [Rhodococcus opacus]
MVTVSELVSALDAELVRLGYKPSTMVWYRGCWRRLERFFASRGVQEFSVNLAMEWVDQACGGFFAKEQAGTLKPTDVYLFRVAQMLDDFAVHGAVLRRYSRTVDRLTTDQADIVARFRAWLRAADCAASTVRTYDTVAGEFLAFTGTRGGLAGLDAGGIDAFVATLAGYQAKTVEQKLCALRSFLRFAAGDGLVGDTVLGTVPAAKSTRQARIPSVWDPADVTKILQAIDRGNPCGKRDYAIILLITRLGLRGIDVKRLRFADFDWPGNRLSMVQAKTGHRVQLPLLKDVGWAVIDYIRYGRPHSDCPEVFLRHTAPIGPFSDQDHLHQILVKHARTAHVAVGEKRRHGMHSLRHTLATRLMEQGTPVEQIADILGHQSTTATGVYLKSSLGLLAECALDPDAPASEATR